MQQRADIPGADGVTDAGLRFPDPGLHIGRAVVYVNLEKTILLFAAAMIVHPRAAFGTVHQAGQWIGFAQRVSTLFAAQRPLRQLPFLLGNDGFMRVLKDHPFLRRFRTAFILEEALAAAEVDSVSHVFGMGQNPGYGCTAPVM